MLAGISTTFALPLYLEISTVPSSKTLYSKSPYVYVSAPAVVATLSLTNGKISPKGVPRTANAITAAINPAANLLSFIIHSPRHIAIASIMLTTIHFNDTTICRNVNIFDKINTQNSKLR